ncbi:hypothetical protein EB232_27490 [Mesorhizobium sp. NZP2077]|nr:hypothetical protein [Mesorhizobium sp. NZP2077]QKC86526.1 hypothetical protein EB232_27490 [Mesorhizobium sp. NZP2077]QKD18426.1 hypothetical protein HGP13_27190 [Mesorhizobium sp. NZP2077]
MSNRETARSHALGTRVTDLRTKMQKARISESEMKVAAIMVDVQGGIDGDDLIAASFVADTLSDMSNPE